MKRSILLFSAVAGLGYLTLTSYSSGPASQAGNRTPSGSNPTCSGSNCHGANNTAVTGITVLMTEMPAGTATTGQYKPGKVYSCELVGLNAAARFGFQITATKAGGGQAGAFIAGPNNKAFTDGTLSGLEHSVGITPASANTFKTQFTWNAPASGAGSVTFHIIINATNGNGSADANDHATTSQMTITENTTSVADLSQNIKVSAFPNPAVNNLNIKIEDAEAGTYTVRVIDLAGRVVHSENVQVNAAAANISLQTGSWAQGMHFAQIIKDDAQRMIPVVKQ